MIRGAILHAASVFEANFVGDMQTLASGISGIDTSLEGVEPRLPAEIFLAFRKTFPRLGVWAESAVTQADIVKVRKSEITLVADYVVAGPDAERVASTAELAVEAILRSLDRMGDPNSYGVVGAAGRERSVRITIARASQRETRHPMERALVRFPVDVWDQI